MTRFCASCAEPVERGALFCGPCLAKAPEQLRAEFEETAAALRSTEPGEPEAWVAARTAYGVAANAVLASLK